MSKHILIYLLFVSKCLYGQGCPNNVYNFGQQKDTSTCVVWGTHHVKTFDDLGYSFQSSCEFTLTSFIIGASEFKVDIVNSPNCRGRKDTCFSYINILYRGVKYQLGLDDTSVPFFKENGFDHRVPVELKAIRVSQPAFRIVVELIGTGITIKWDEKNMVEVTIENKKNYEPLGLCGNNDRCSSNDQMLITRATTDDIFEFLGEWQVDRQSCPGTIEVAQPCKGVKQNIAKAEQACKAILESLRFREAHGLVKLEFYIDACISNYCTCTSQNTMDCLCETFDVYAKASINAGVKKIAWRGPNLCKKECKGDETFYPCAPKGGSRTCSESALVTGAEPKCEEGCYCPVTTFLYNDGKCYLKKQCPCSYNGVTYKPGNTVKQSCHLCTCVNGKFDCPKEPCMEVSAVFTGDPHYTTWDGKRFDFMGKCSYYLVQTNDFSIEADHYVWQNGQFVKADVGGPSYTRRIVIRMDNQVVDLNPNLVVIVNNQTVTRYPHTAGTLIITKPSSSKVLVQLPNYVQVEWDGYSTGVIRLPTTLEGKVMGLLGTYTGDQSDDFLTPLGDLVDDPVEFGNSWKTEYSCQDEPPVIYQHPCDANPGAKGSAEKLCSPIKSDIFKKCDIQDVDTSFDNCIYDTCYCKENLTKCACDLIAAFAEGCARKGISVDWRNKVPHCRLPCPSGQVYQECNDGCSRTCEDISLRPNCPKVCVEGCNCAPGTTMDEEGQCIPISQCKCRIHGTLFPPGFELIKNEDELITCKNAKWIVTVPTETQLTVIPSLEQLNRKCDAIPFSVYTACRYSTPKTCENMHSYQIQKIDRCVEACTCMDGYVVNTKTGKCVEPENCPCYDNGKSHKDGTYFEKEDCRECTCIQGSWSCVQGNCGKECKESEQKVDGCKKCICDNGKWSCSEENCLPQKCQIEDEVKIQEFGKCICKRGEWKCIHGQCDVWGDSHIKTFDGVRYDFQGKCSYVLAESKIGGDEFRVYFTNQKCSHAGATCLKSATIHVDIGGVKESLTLTKNEVLPRTDSYKKLVLSDQYLFVTIDVVGAGIQIFWDKSTWLYVKLDKKWQNKVSGLCGNYNQQRDDDLVLQAQQISIKDPLPFVDYWKTDSKCEKTKPNANTCDESRGPWAERQCDILNSKVFAACHAKVPVENYYQACVMDSCKCDLGGDCECLCTGIATYAHHCSNYGVPIKWRSQHMCPVQCPLNTQYEPCVSPCPQKTCETIKKNITINCDEETCIEGCAPKPLPDGYVWVDTTYDQSVLEESCTKPTCNVNGKIYYDGVVITQTKCSICYCTEGNKKCMKVPCSDDLITPSTGIPTGTTTTALYPRDESVPPKGNGTTPKPTTPGAVTPNVITEETSTPGGVTPHISVGTPTTTPGTVTPPCDKTKCKPLNCPSFTREVEIAGQCCNSCQHEKNCIANLYYYNQLVFKEPGKTWTDGPCRECTCEGDQAYNHCTRCRTKVCDNVSESSQTTDDIYYEYQQGECCKLMEPLGCVYENKIYRINEQWDVDDCRSLRCVKDRSTNSVLMQEVTEYCNENCPAGYIYKKPKNTCCGECVQEGCAFENTLKAVGEKWFSKDGCTFYVCELQKGQFKIHSRKTICPTIRKCSGVIKKSRCCEYCSTSELFTWKNEPLLCNFEPILT